MLSSCTILCYCGIFSIVGTHCVAVCYQIWAQLWDKNHTTLPIMNTFGITPYYVYPIILKLFTQIIHKTLQQYTLHNTLMCITLGKFQYNLEEHYFTDDRKSCLAERMHVHWRQMMVAPTKPSVQLQPKNARLHGVISRAYNFNCSQVVW